MFAANARALTEIARQPKNAWSVLFKKIKEAAEKGEDKVIFNEERELTFFSENRKVVKQKLEEMGYEVSYTRKPTNPEVMLWNTYYNEYTVKW